MIRVPARSLFSWTWSQVPGVCLGHTVLGGSGRRAVTRIFWSHWFLPDPHTHTSLISLPRSCGGNTDRIHHKGIHGPEEGPPGDPWPFGAEGSAFWLASDDLHLGLQGRLPAGFREPMQGPGPSPDSKGSRPGTRGSGPRTKGAMQARDHAWYL